MKLRREMDRKTGKTYIRNGYTMPLFETEEEAVKYVEKTKGGCAYTCVRNVDGMPTQGYELSWWNDSDLRWPVYTGEFRLD